MKLKNNNVKKDRELANKKANGLLTAPKPNTIPLKMAIKAEISAITKIAEALQGLDYDSIVRVLKWAEDKFIKDK